MNVAIDIHQHDFNYVEPPDIPEGMTIAQWRAANRGKWRKRSIFHKVVTISLVANLAAAVRAVQYYLQNPRG